MYFSTYTSALPNAASASDWAMTNAGCELRFFKDHPHALAPASGNGLYDDREAKLAGKRQGVGLFGDDPGCPAG